MWRNKKEKLGKKKWQKGHLCKKMHILIMDKRKLDREFVDNPKRK